MRIEDRRNYSMTCKDWIELALSISSLVCAIVSIVIVILTIRQNNKMLEESSRPILSVYATEGHTGSMPVDYIAVRNFGNSAATVESLEYNYNLAPCYDIDGCDKDWLQGVVGTVIAPGQSKICFIDFNKIEEPVEFSISYRSGAGKQYKEKYTVDFSAGAMLEGSTTPKNDEAALISIAVLMQEMLKRDL